MSMQYVENVPSNNNSKLASPQHRLGGFVLEAALCTVTFYIGWFIWSLVVWGQGLTPAKQILKMRVINDADGKPAKWGHMALRQFLVPFTAGLIFWVLLIIAGVSASDPYAYNNSAAVGVIAIIYIAYFALWVTDSFWLMRADRKRLVDVIVKTHVTNEAN